MRYAIAVKCPYCGILSPVPIELKYDQQKFRDLIYCEDGESGGCGEWFVYEAMGTISFSSKTSAIEWKNELALDGVTEALKRGW